MNFTSKQLLLFDGFGALLSAFLLGIVLVKFQHLVGMPRQALYFLAFLPCLFAAYDFYCYFNLKKDFAKYLKYIAYANLFYCIISLGLATQHYEQLTQLGWIYFILEIIIVVGLAIFELKTANSSIEKQSL